MPAWQSVRVVNERQRSIRLRQSTVRPWDDRPKTAKWMSRPFSPGYRPAAHCWEVAGSRITGPSDQQIRRARHDTDDEDEMPTVTTDDHNMNQRSFESPSRTKITSLAFQIIGSRYNYLIEMRDKKVGAIPLCQNQRLQSGKMISGACGNTITDQRSSLNCFRVNLWLARPLSYGEWHSTYAWIWHRDRM
jgi:hypothetical protein